MNRMTELHEKAMEASDEAFFARRRGDVQAADTFARQVFETERLIAMALAGNPPDDIVEELRDWSDSAFHPPL